ncbi:MarR family winged helix-turn-helix transcriptional regulator [Raoultibacter timonensis]|uniref:MarR family transcriptional regulator n=1 Tax=Raoultibacter timonensis TaxID=1907662 RepID=A0ABN6MMF7_9ACTN|nr:MarR family transcriptional regulator [Raoultibacter timonensis]BDE97738.1 MarR family transcriptional regulator [Raoultibacter timonensis]BDF52341.1 MarR family transcriptional regulator [Raoultibacter timonensis]
MQYVPTDSTQRQLLRSLSYFSVRLKYVERKSFFGLSGRQVLLLASLCSFDEPPSLGELSEANGASHQNIKQILLKLEKAGYVTIRPDEHDNRALLVEPTDMGRNLAVLYNEKIDEVINHLFEDISEKDAATCVAVVEKLREGLKELL